MLLLLIEFLRRYMHVQPPAVFSYSSTRMLLCAISSLLISILLGPFVIRRLYGLKTGRSIRTGDCPVLVKLHEKKKDTPSMGGVLILFSMLISLLLWMDLSSIYTLILAGTTLYLGLVGGIDDALKMKRHSAKGLSARVKLSLQLFLGLLIAGYLLWSPEGLMNGKIFAPPVGRLGSEVLLGGGS